MPIWVVNLLSSVVGVGVLVLAHYGIIPTDIGGLIAGAMMYQLGGQAYHFTLNKSAANGAAITTTTAPDISTSSTGSGIPDVLVPEGPTLSHPTAKGS